MNPIDGRNPLWENWDIYIRYNFEHKTFWAATKQYCKQATPSIKSYPNNPVSHLTEDNEFYVYDFRTKEIDEGFEKNCKGGFIIIDNWNFLKILLNKTK